jgi:hypothetical protein
MLDDARDIDVILRLESQLLERERELETLRGQQRTLEDRVSLATIFVTIEQSGVVRDRSAFVVTAWLNETQSAQCSGTSELAIDPNGSAGLCVEIENVGDIELTDLELRADALNLRTDDFAIEGDLGALAPGDIITATAELNATDGFVGRTELAETIEVRVQVSGVAVDDPTVAMASSSEVALSSAQEEPLPGFLDGLEGALAVLATIGSALLLLAGIALPFVPVIALVVWFLRRSRHKRNAEGTSSQDSAPADDIEREAQHDTTGA